MLLPFGSGVGVVHATAFWGPVRELFMPCLSSGYVVWDMHSGWDIQMQRPAHIPSPYPHPPSSAPTPALAPTLPLSPMPLKLLSPSPPHPPPLSPLPLHG